VKGIPGAAITVDQEKGGPPTGKPIAIEISGDNLDDLVSASQGLKRFLDAKNIAGVEELKSDLQNIKPEVVIEIDRERANREGISTGQVGGAIRYAVFGLEASKFRDQNDEYKIMVRFKEDQRNSVEALLNQRITFRDMNMGGILRQIPLSSVATAHYSNNFGGITRKNQKRIVTLSSNVSGGFNENDVVQQVKNAMTGYELPQGLTVKFGGAQEDQQETSGFLGNAGLIAIGLIFLVLVTQFNSLSKPLIILTQIFFSIIGVFLGLAITGMNVSIIMTGVGIVALAGIVVRNGILIIEFADLLRSQGMELFDAIVEAGRTRMTPVLLTATAAILGLIPLAVGMNIDFYTMFSELNPHIFFGGDSVAFWGPLSWTIIFGLSFATLVTLIIVPTLYLMVERLKLRIKRKPNQIDELPEGHNPTAPQAEVLPEVAAV